MLFCICMKVFLKMRIFYDPSSESGILSSLLSNHLDCLAQTDCLKDWRAFVDGSSENNDVRLVPHLSRQVAGSSPTKARQWGYAVITADHQQWVRCPAASKPINAQNWLRRSLSSLHVCGAIAKLGTSYSPVIE